MSANVLTRGGFAFTNKIPKSQTQNESHHLVIDTRIEKNISGVCELTGKKSSKTRLTAVPWARYTVEAQARLEKEGAVRQRNKLGSLGTIDGAGASKTTVSESADSGAKSIK